MSHTDLLKRTTDLALEFLDGLPARRVGPSASVDELRATLGGPLPEQGTDAREVVEHLARAAGPGLIGTAGPRYFGFVIGGHVPAALAADWLTSAWDQNATLYVSSPANSVVEEAAAGWLLEILGLPATASVGFTTGCSMANFTALAAARHAVLAQRGWNVETDGLFGAPPIDVVIGDEAHATVLAALQMLGLGRERVKRVAVDGQGRMVPAALREVLKGGSGPVNPLIVCAQAGNVNTGAFDPLDEIVPIVREARERGAWLHVDGAFGLWAAAHPALAHLVRGAAGADSWATDAHKWLNVPYDSGLVMVAHPEPHRAAMTISAAYLAQTGGGERDPFDWVPEFSRRARGFTVWAALKSLGRAGVAAMVERCCTLARRFADRLRDEPGVEILNDVVLNQVLVRFRPPAAEESYSDADALTRDVIAAVQADGTCWLGGTTWQGKAAMRISVSGWETTEADVDVSAAAILRSFRAAC